MLPLCKHLPSHSLLFSRLSCHHSWWFKTHQRFIRPTKKHISTVAYRFDMISGSLCILNSACVIASQPSWNTLAFWLPNAEFRKVKSSLFSHIAMSLCSPARLWSILCFYMHLKGSSLLFVFEFSLFFYFFVTNSTVFNRIFQPLWNMEILNDFVFSEF